MKIKWLLALGCLTALTATAQRQVECWGRFEIPIEAKVKGNPFDTELKAVFEGPDTTVTVTGFYAGDNLFKVRFMPVKQGKWSYTTQSTAAELNGKRGALVCTAPSADNHGPVVTDGLHFKYADGTRYYPVGTTSYDWMHVAGDYPDRTVRALAESKFNKVRMLLMVQNFDKDFPEPERFPFETKRVKKDSEGRPVYEWDFSRPNPAYFDHVEQCIDRLAQIGVEADLILFHPYDEGRWGFDRMPMEANTRYLKYVTARLSSFRNVWWSLANEYDFLKARQPEDWDAFMHTVVDNDPYRHLISNHSNTAKYYPYWLPEITHASIQDQAPVDCQQGAATVRNIYKKPVIFDEVCYEGNMDNRWGSLSGEEMLYRMWTGLMGGTYVSHSECYMDSPTDYWKDFLAVGGEFQGESWKRIGFMRRILEAMPNPLQLCDGSWDRCTSTAGENYLMLYLGKEVKTEWEFDLPVRNAVYPRLKEGTRFRVEIIDTWDMTVTECPKTFVTGKPTRYRIYDKDFGRVPLPGKPYLLLRITEVK